MKIQKQYIEKTLSNIDIEAFSSLITQFTEPLKIDSKEKLRISLSFEEIFLCFQKQFGDNTPAKLILSSSFGTPYISLHVAGTEFNPLEESNEDNSLLSPLLQEAGIIPIFSFRKGINEIHLPIHQKKSTATVLFFSILFALIIGFAGKKFFPDLCVDCSAILIKPTFKTFLGILSLLCPPLVFFSICIGILTLGKERSNLSKISTPTILCFFKYNLLSLFFFMAVIMFCFPPHWAAASKFSAVDKLNEITKLIFGLIPNNLVAPFVSGNIIQVLILAVVASFFLLTGAKKYPVVIDLLNQLNAFFQGVMNKFGSYSYLLIFLIVLDQIWTSDLTQFLQLLSIMGVLTLGFILYALTRILYTAWIVKQSPLTLLSYIITPSLIALFTASSASAYSEMLISCKNKMHIDSSMFNFSLPLGLVLSKENSIPLFIGVSLYCAYLFDMEISFAWLLSTCLFCYIIPLAVPPVAGGSLLCITTLFAQLNIPTEALNIGMCILLFEDFIATATKVGTMLLITYQVAYKNDYVTK